jgi:hypothetical protein
MCGGLCSFEAAARSTERTFAPMAAQDCADSSPPIGLARAIGTRRTARAPSLPTFFIASAMIVPIDSSELAEIVPTCAIALSSAVGLDRFFSSAVAAMTALSMPRLRSIGFMPAATAFMPSRISACASTVAVVVPSPGVTPSASSSPTSQTTARWRMRTTGPDTHFLNAAAARRRRQSGCDGRLSPPRRSRHTPTCRLGSHKVSAVISAPTRRHSAGSRPEASQQHVSSLRSLLQHSCG